MAMIKHFLDNDAYKFSMGCLISALYPRVHAEYTFFNRGETQFPDGFVERLQKEVDSFVSLRLAGDERKFLEERCSYLNPVYLDLLQGFKFDPGQVDIDYDERFDLSIKIRGPWYRAIFWEVPLMSVISELYFEMTDAEPVFDDEYDIQKAHTLTGLSVADFGSRRRFSQMNQDRVVGILKEHCKTFVGTSNVYFAKKYYVKPIGTQAHEYHQATAGLYGFSRVTAIAVSKWLEFFGGDIGVCLSDTFTTDVFFRQFSKLHAKTYDGIRQDSGDPITFTDKAFDYYTGMGIDPASKTIVYSDGLSPAKAWDIENYVRNKANFKTAYGIGTNLTNDVGVKPLNIVIKMTGINAGDGTGWVPVIKLSDSLGKHTGNSSMIELCKQVLGIDKVWEE